MLKKDKNKNLGEPKESQGSIPKKLLGELEAEIMEHMWDIEQARVQHVVRLINRKRPIAYTTVMTVMGHLAEKGLLNRTSEGNRYIYKVAQSKEEFLRNTSKNMVRSILHDFGDLAIAGFLGEISRIKPEKLDEVKSLLQEAMDENPTSE